MECEHGKLGFNPLRFHASYLYVIVAFVSLNDGRDWSASLVVADRRK